MFYKSFSITGVANKTEMHDGLVSTIEEPKKIRAILVTVSKYRANIIEGWIETNRILAIIDYVLNSLDDSRGVNPIVRIPIDEVITPGKIFKIGINCGATATDLHGAYEYEHTT